MPEKPAAVEHQENATLRAQVCAECSDARADLNTLVQAEITPDKGLRKTELTGWVAKNLPNFEPQEAAIAACLEIERTEAAAGFPDFRVEQIPLVELREEVALLAAIHQAETERASSSERNANTSGEIDAGVPAKVPAEVGAESRILTDEAGLENNQTALETHRANLTVERARDQKTNDLEKAKTTELRQLQTVFNQLRADGMDTTEALRTIIDQAQNPKTQQHLNAILSKVAMLQTALPHKPDVVNRLLNTTGLNLAAATVAGSFAGFMTAAESDDSLSDQDCAVLRQIIQQGDEHLRTGTQVRQTALETTIDPNTGEPAPVHTKDNKAEVCPGVFTYTETGQNIILEVNESGLRQKVDVTGLDGQSIGLVVEIMSLSAMAETSGASGFMKHVYGVDFNRLTAQRFDPITLNGLSQKLTHLLGTGHDGKIMQPAQRRQLLQTQMRLVSPTGSSLAWEDDPDGYRESVAELGLDNDAVLEAFGQYTQLHAGAGSINRDQIQRHLHQQFPDMVSAPTGDKESDLAA